MIYKTGIKICCLILFVCAFFSNTSHADLNEEELLKRKKVRYAVEQGILSIYDIPFSTYVKLEMWDEIDFIFEANNKNMIRYELPGIYYSRPYIVNDTIWVFENAAQGGGVYIFEPETLKFLKKINHTTYEKYDGGVRKVFGNTIVSGGSDEDVDSAVIWDTNNNDVKIVKLEHGHYVNAIEIDGELLYIGSCGGLINTWNYQDLNFLGTFSSSKQENVNWRIFNEKECITRIKVLNNKLIGIGEKSVFVWNLENGQLMNRYSKIFSNSIVFFYKTNMIEYKNNRLVVWNLETGERIRDIKVEKSIEDLIVTSEKILAKHEGELLILALRHNKGLLLYDYNTLTLLNKINTMGESLAAYQNAIFATDDKNLYRYDIANKNSEKYNAFLKRIKPENLLINDTTTYYQLLRRLQDYPEIIQLTGLAKKFLALHNLAICQSFKYGKIGEEYVSSEQDEWGNGYKKDIFGYKLIYEVKNDSNNYYFVSIAAQWSGEYGKYRTTKAAKIGERWDAANRGFAKQDFFIIPHRGKYKNHFDIGEKEPVNFMVYPMVIEKISKAYYDEFMTALSNENEDIALIDKYLKDRLVKGWHKQLKDKKDQITKDRSVFWFLRN